MFKETIGETFGFLVRSRNRYSGAVLAEALHEPVDRVQAWAALAACLKRDRRLLRETVAAYSRLCDRARRIVTRYSEAFLPVLRDSICSDDQAVREGAFDLVCRIGGLRTAYLLVMALSSADADLRERAAEQLVDAVKEYHNLEERHLHGADELVAEDLEAKRMALLDPVLVAIKRYSIHRKDEVIEVAIGLDRRGDDVLVDILASKFDERRPVILGILRKSTQGRIIAFLLEMLKEDDVAALAEEIIASRTGTEFIKALAKARWRIKEPAFVRRLARIKHLSWVESGALAKAVRSARSEEVMGIAGFILLTGIPKEQKIRAMIQLQEAVEGPLREMARAVMVQIMGGKPSGEIALKLIHALERVKDPAFAAGMLQSAEPVSEEGYTLERLLKQIGRLNAEAVKRIYEGVAKRDEHAMTKVHAAMRSDDPDRQIAALQLTLVAGELHLFAADIVALAICDDARVRASAVRVLGNLRDQESMKALLDAVLDLNRRVVANAVEAMEDTGFRVLANILVPMLKHPNNRIRANTVKALWVLGYPQAIQILLTMAKSNSEKMRISALWAMSFIEFGGRIQALERMVANDPSPEVQRRVEELLERLKT